MDGFKQNGNCVEALLADCQMLPTYQLAALVKSTESTEPGQLVVEKNSNRHLYAILKPTHNEYLERLRVLLDSVDEQALGVVQIYFRFTLNFVKYCDCIEQYYLNGEISYLVYCDLMARAWELRPFN